MYMREMSKPNIFCSHHQKHPSQPPQKILQQSLRFDVSNGSKNPLVKYYSDQQRQSPILRIEILLIKIMLWQKTIVILKFYCTLSPKLKVAICNFFINTISLLHILNPNSTKYKQKTCQISIKKKNILQIFTNFISYWFILCNQIQLMMQLIYNLIIIIFTQYYAQTNHIFEQKKKQPKRSNKPVNKQTILQFIHQK
eukprot:TRINITY_DN4278_c1_g1_i1.p1 TRINITY_DN4278_c1_g1~~TRINITY_DN4278_c1_g1_i1.p1  ORF type:complete len:197 (+),score=-17.15 TRINITY_DN4278_c1_g1_i1:124-714(+)